MKTDGLFTTHSVTIPAKLNHPYRLILFGDVHRDAPLHALPEWKRFLEYAKRQKDAYFLGMGDYFDAHSTSERAILMSGGLHESTVKNWEEQCIERIEKFAKELEFMRGRLIGLIGGNHYFSFRDGTTSDQKLCSLLDTRYLGACSFIRLAFDVGRRNRAAWDIFAHHGAGGGRLAGSTFNRVEQMQFMEADLYAMGHDHKRGIVPGAPRLFPIAYSGGVRLGERLPWLARSGSFLKGFEPGQASYVVDAAKGPCSIGHVECELTLVRDRSNGIDAVRVECRGIS